MSAAVTAFVVVAVAAVLFAGIRAGFDAAAVVIAAVIASCGALAIAVARKSASRNVAPGRCDRCGRLISPSAPYCKHCGTPAPDAG